MSRLKVLNSSELLEINGGAEPGPSTLGVEIAHFMADFIKGAYERFNLFRD